MRSVTSAYFRTTLLKEKETEAAHGASRRNFAALHMAKQQEQRKPYEVAFRCTFKKSFARKW